MKSGIRIAAITSGPISKKNEKREGVALAVAVIGSANGIEGVLSSRVAVDGFDSTGKIIRMIKRSRFREQVKAVALNGIAIAGLNIVDVEELYKKLRCPVIIVTRKRPRRSLLARSVRLVGKSGSEKKMKIALLKNQNAARKMEGFYVQAHPDIDIGAIVATSAHLLRLSHMISSGIARGESKGRI
ncbi:DUF99 family protein [Candidatus Marsarchaeota archaeon]|nr:DUF99 family protein [Candidatus Marsarchaeota archaeon]